MELEKEIEQLKKRIELLESIVLNNVHSESNKNEEKGFKIGVGSETEEATEQENALRKAFGLAPKK